MNNKRFTMTVLSAMLVIAVALSSFAAPSFARRKLGDVDGDGDITSGDARLALRASVQLENLSTEQMMAANVDSDQFVTSADARLILRASVMLEALPDIEVGYDETTGAAPMTDPYSEPETTAVPEPQTTAVPEPETTAVPEPETTAVPEPETTAVPEPETTEPASEPRDGFVQPEKDNEYDILRTGTYYFIGETVDSDGRSELEVARTSNSLYMSADFGSAKVGIMKVGKKAYLVAPEKNAYLDLNTLAMKAQMKLIGIDMDEMFATNAFDFSIFPPLEKATRSERQEDDPTSVKYVFETDKGAINVTMRGKTLLCLENAQDGNVYRIDFKSVAGDVPSERREVKNLKSVSELKFFTYMTEND